MVIGSNIKKNRQIKGLTQEQLAELAGLSSNYISQIENGKNIGFKGLNKIAAALEVPVSFLAMQSHENKSKKVDDIVSDLTGCNDKELEFVHALLVSA
ncbi:MAG: helix-turn-helix domain-containing protein, partial [Lachnospiraceae bacterium]